MLAQTPIEQRFYAFVASFPPEQTYYWRDMDKCPCGLFLQDELGIAPYIVQGAVSYPNATGGGPEAEVSRRIWDQFNAIARADDHTDWTFGKLAKRIEELMPECVA